MQNVKKFSNKKFLKTLRMNFGIADLSKKIYLRNTALFKNLKNSKV
jgi:hypothetical protein